MCLVSFISSIVTTTTLFTNALQRAYPMSTVPLCISITQTTISLRICHNKSKSTKKAGTPARVMFL